MAWAIGGIFLTNALLLFATEESEMAFFETKIRPVLIEHCYKCHSAESEKFKGGLRVDSRDAFLKGGDSGPAIIPGEPEKSLLIKAIRHLDPNLKMPPRKGGDRKLADAQIADIFLWIEKGAIMPTTTNAVAAKYDYAVGRTNWAFRKPNDPPVPTISGPNVSGVDAFLAAKLQVKGLNPVPQADKATLLRRATFDLTGLPPALAELDAFLNDHSTNAFATIVDRLLASPRYGEKWGRHWLDVVRYTDSFDSRGLGGEADVPEAWRYRDWVVNAFNSDMPYDQFITQQIAGDILATNVPGEFDTNALIATGVFVIGEWGTGDADKEKMLTDIVDDQIDVTSRGFLGLTMACARCHDHKFDPISTDDYYGMAGIFFSSHILPNPGAKTAGSPVLRIPLASAAELAAIKANEQRAAELENEIAAKTGTTSLTRLMRGEFNQPALAALHPQEGDLPDAVANPGEAAIHFLTITLPARSIAIHPSPEKNAAAVWVSPFMGEVEITGRVADADDKCGNGVEWKLFQGTNVLAAGKFDNGKEQAIPRTRSVLKSGELLTLAVMPRGKDHSCDTTVIELNIRDRESRQTWRLPEDVVDDLPARAQTGPWRFIAFGGTPPQTLDSTVTDEEKVRLDRARRELAGLDRKLPVAHALQEGGTPKSAYEGFRDAHIMVRGRYDCLGEVAPRHFPRVIAENQTPIRSGSGRLELARWIASKENPLTARVMVNRIWQHHFGEGIVRTPNNFGKLGTPPTHPELLDWLAHRFMDSGWSIKAMHRLMMNSAAYQQAVADGKNDPDNLFFARMNRRRLEAEEIRDALLAVTGQLDLAMGGTAINDLNTKRRTLYVMTIRSDKSSYRSLFDAPDAQSITEKRVDSMVAPQALFLLNSPFALAQANALAERVTKQDPRDDIARINWLYHLLYGRRPRAQELELGLRAVTWRDELHESQSDRTGTHGVRPSNAEARLTVWQRYCQVLLCANEFIFVD
jgi:hypothetical protein